MKFAAGIVLSIAALTVAVAGDAPTIYRCDQDGATIYSDRPCAADASPHELDDSRVTVYEAPATSERATSSVTKSLPLCGQRLAVKALPTMSSVRSDAPSSISHCVTCVQKCAPVMASRKASG